MISINSRYTWKSCFQTVKFCKSCLVKSRPVVSSHSPFVFFGEDGFSGVMISVVIKTTVIFFKCAVLKKIGRSAWYFSGIYELITSELYGRLMEKKLVTPNPLLGSVPIGTRFFTTPTPEPVQPRLQFWSHGVGALRETFWKNEGSPNLPPVVIYTWNLLVLYFWGLNPSK